MFAFRLLTSLCVAISAVGILMERADDGTSLLGTNSKRRLRALEGDWVSLDGVHPNITDFTRDLLALCRKRRLIGTNETARVEAALQGSGVSAGNDYELLGFALLHAPIEGMHLEFGVNAGHSANVSGLILRAMAHEQKLTPPPVLDGFDTFTGLPTEWKGHMKQNAFAQHDGRPPPVEDNVRLHKGLFKDTLPKFLADKPEKEKWLAFANLDADLYAGTIEVLRMLQTHLRVGSVLHFHELVSATDNLNPMEEMNALHEFLLAQDNTFRLELLSIVDQVIEPVVLRVASL